MLQSSSKETVIHANSFSSFSKYMHTKRNIENEIVEIITNLNNSDSKKLILLAGSVGDGKSHLISYLNDSYEQYLQDVDIHNDATESFDPQSSSVETLEKVLQSFNDGKVPNKHIIVAINLGVLHNFYRKQRENNEFNALCNFIDKSGVFEKTATSVVDDQFHLFNFASERIFNLKEDGAYSPFFETILKKVVSNDEENPIYRAWKHDMDNNIVTIAHINYELLQQEAIQHRILDKLYHVMLLDKLIVSTRSFYNFIYTIIVPIEQDFDPTKTSFSLQNTLPYLLFEHPERSTILSHIHKIDPLKKRQRKSDEYVANLHILKDKWAYLVDLFEEEQLSDLLGGAFEQLLKESIHAKKIDLIAKFIVRMIEIMKPPKNSSYYEFLGYLYHYYKGNGEQIYPLVEMLKEVFEKWKGSPEKDYYFVKNDVGSPYRIAYPVLLEEEPGEEFGILAHADVVSNFENYLTIGFSVENEVVLFELDFYLYELLQKINNGYKPNMEDINSALQFEDFYKQIMNVAEANAKEFLIVRNEDQSTYLISKPKSKFGSSKLYKVESK